MVRYSMSRTHPTQLASGPARVPRPLRGVAAKTADATAAFRGIYYTATLGCGSGGCFSSFIAGRTYLFAAPARYFKPSAFAQRESERLYIARQRADAPQITSEQCRQQAPGGLCRDKVGEGGGPIFDSALCRKRRKREGRAEIYDKKNSPLKGGCSITECMSNYF